MRATCFVSWTFPRHLPPALPVCLQGEHEPPTASMPDSVGLVDGCVVLAERAPATAFWLCDLLKAHSALSTPNRQVGGLSLCGWKAACCCGDMRQCVALPP